jgi:hypothetical protein
MYGFGTGTLIGVQTQDATGAAVANATPVQFGTLQDISGDIGFEEKLLYGAYQFPVAAGRGKGNVSFKAKAAGIYGSIFSDLFFGTGSVAGIKADVINFPAAIPASTPWQITVAPPNTGTFVSDLGVLNAATGMPMKKVASAPATGQYSVSGVGVYTFATADANAAVLISYEYSATSTSAKVVAISNQLMGYAPTFRASLNLSYGGKNLTFNLNSCISSKLSLPLKNDDFTIPEFDFSAIADAAGNIGYVALSE